MGRGRRAIGIIRISQVRGRAGESFASPTEQADRIRADCAREGLDLIRVEEELDVSGGRNLDDRPGLGPAVRAIEAGEADVIVGAYFDRLFRSLRAQGEAVERVERAGGQVRAVDVGSVSAGSAGQWLSGTMMGAISEYFRRSTAERTREAQAAAIRRGVAPYGRVPAGYRKRPDGVFEPDPKTAPVVAEAFTMRARGETVNVVWRHLRAGGVAVTYGGAYALLHSRVVLGEIHFGGLEPNLEAHEPIVDRDTWDAVQRVRVPSGRKAQSERFLARLGVLRCGTCDSRMAGSTATGARSAGGGGGRKYAVYRCGNKDCPRQMSIMAQLADDAVERVARAILSEARGRASVERERREAVTVLEREQARLDKLIELLDPFEPAAERRIAAQTAERDDARDRVEELSGFEDVDVIDVSRWDDLSVDVRRRAIQWALIRVRVLPGRGPRRLDFEPRVE
jgi:site-specific DNA recombinase